MRRAAHLVLAIGLLLGAAACEDELASHQQEGTPAATPGGTPTDGGPPDGEPGPDDGEQRDGGPGGGGERTGTTGGDGPLLLILDSSESMGETGTDGHVLLEGARQAVRDLTAALPDDQQVGLRVYGHRHATLPRACEDTELVHPVSTLDRAAIDDAVGGVSATGRTPIGLSLREGAGDLPDSGPRTIILVSDGLDNCAPPDPCEVANDLTAATNEFVIHTIGFALGDGADADRARDQLACIAAAGGGEFEDADNAAELADSLHRSAAK